MNRKIRIFGFWPKVEGYLEAENKFFSTKGCKSIVESFRSFNEKLGLRIITPASHTDDSNNYDVFEIINEELFSLFLLEYGEYFTIKNE